MHQLNTILNWSRVAHFLVALYVFYLPSVGLQPADHIPTGGLATVSCGDKPVKKNNCVCYIDSQIKHFIIPLHFQIFFSFPFRKTLLKYYRGNEPVGVVGRVTSLQFWLSGFQIPAGANSFSPIQNVQTTSGAHPAPYSMSTGILPSEFSGRIVKLTSYLHVVSSLRRSGATLLLQYTPSWRGEGLYHCSKKGKF